MADKVIELKELETEKCKIKKGVALKQSLYSSSDLQSAY